MGHRPLPLRSIDQAPHVVGADPGRNAVFTSAAHSKAAADSLSKKGPVTKPYAVVNCSRGKWREDRGINYKLRKTRTWSQRRPALMSALHDTPSAKVHGAQQLLRHICHRLHYSAAAVGHFGDRPH